MSEFIRVTEQPSKYRHLEHMSVHELLVNINAEDKLVPLAVEAALPAIEAQVPAAAWVW
jgi:N-acetylmuramic acid 6-phosphate etherase